MTSTSEPKSRWRQLVLLAVIELLAMALWFSASAVTPELRDRWALSPSAQAWLTISVQLGFALGALASAVLNIQERVGGPRLIAICSVCGAVCNATIALGFSDALGRSATGFSALIALRMLTGVMLAGIYPTGMKLMATWFKERRGLAIGVLVGALTVGSASPHLINAFPLSSWKIVMVASAVCAVIAGFLSLVFARTGPHLPTTSRFDWTYFARVWTTPALRRANFGYLGHMLELYAMWTWIPQVLAISYVAERYDPAAARIAAFAVIAIGGLGCVLAGLAADKLGRCLTTVVSLLVSGGCALVAGSLIDQPVLLTAVCLVWGFAVVADSAQFSAAISELCDPRFVGTALTVQTCAGFLLTTVTIAAAPHLADVFGWQLALAMLAIGPAFGIYHMLRLRGLDEATKMAGGNR